MLDWESQNTESVQAVLDSFTGVWERVSGTQAGGPTEAERPEETGSAAMSPRRKDLRELIETAAESAMYDRALACRCRGGSRAALQEHAAQASHRAACLRGELFVRSGERLCPKDSCPRLGDTLTALREGMLRDEASAAAYRQAAKRADGELREKLERFACETEAAAAEKRRMILRSFQ